MSAPQSRVAKPTPAASSTTAAPATASLDTSQLDALTCRLQQALAQASEALVTKQALEAEVQRLNAALAAQAAEARALRDKCAALEDDVRLFHEDRAERARLIPLLEGLVGERESLHATLASQQSHIDALQARNEILATRLRIAQGTIDDSDALTAGSEP